VRVDRDPIASLTLQRTHLPLKLLRTLAFKS
jgi:hypothetical protein